MARLVYYVAQTLDGFIAEPDGGVRFLDGLGEDGDDFGYAGFEAGIDSLIMGRGTYEFVEATGTWPYAGKPTWLMTSHPVATPPLDAHVTDASPAEVLRAIRETGATDTWLVGGGRLAGAFAQAGLIDEWIVTVVPNVMGQGVPLAAPLRALVGLDLVRNETCKQGVVQLTYRKRAD